MASNRAQHGASARTGKARQSRKSPTKRVPASRSRAATPRKTSSVPRKTTSAPRKPSSPPRKAPPRARKRARLPLRYVPVAIVALFVILGWTLYPVVRLSYRQQRERVKLEQQLAEIKGRNDELRQEVARLRTPAGVEDVARERLGFVKKGEHMYVVMPSGPATGSDPEGAAVRTAGLSGGDGFLERALDAVFGVGR